jgi:translation initiation factor IF-3
MRQDKRAAPKAPINENISAREVRLIGAEGEQLGIVSIEDALLKAEEAKLDLVEISADAVPPVCKLMDYGKSIFEKKKQIAAAKKTRSRFRLKKSSFVQGRRKGITR